MKSYRFLSRLVVIIGLIVITMSSSTRSSVLAAATITHRTADPIYLANIRGEVTAQGGKLHLAGAQVDIPALDLHVTSDASGKFSLVNIPLKTGISPVDVRVSAPGYGEWNLQNALVRKDDTLILNVDLNDRPFLQRFPETSQPKPAELISHVGTAFGQTLTPSIDDKPLPSTVRVGITGNIACSSFVTTTYSVQTVDFKSYVKHVLPNEWLYTWGRESLRAGAVAVKMYAWYWITLGGKWRGTDVIDSTCDQVYNPIVEYESTNQAVDFTWNWKLTRQGDIFQTYHKNTSDCDPPSCLQQSVSAEMATHGYTWDQILSYSYPGSKLSLIHSDINAYSLRFTGTPGDGPLVNRVEFSLVDPRYPDNRLPINVGADDFTIEWWMKTAPGDNSSGLVSCGKNQNWKQGNIIFDRSRAEAGSQYGISIARSRLVFGITTSEGESLSLCGSTSIADNQWHHIAVQRRRMDGALWMFVDGHIDATAVGPLGDLSYFGSNPGAAQFDAVLFLGGGKENEPHLPHPFYAGWIDELRFSSILRYSLRGNFQPPDSPFKPDANTLALYHFDDGIGSTITDVPGTSAGSNNGRRFYGGLVNGPDWWPSLLFYNYHLYIPNMVRTR
jgi:hypothetical protein